MKTFIALILVIATSSMTWAEVRGNPDRFISIGVMGTVADLSGPWTERSGPFTYRGDAEAIRRALEIDFRVPVSNSVTLLFLWEGIRERTVFEREGGLYQPTADINGHRFGAGARFYFIGR